jgi:hypothetical protein
MDSLTFAHHFLHLDPKLFGTLWHVGCLHTMAALLAFSATCGLFHFANAAILPLLGQKIAVGSGEVHEGTIKSRHYHFNIEGIL